MAPNPFSCTKKQATTLSDSTRKDYFQTVTVGLQVVSLPFPIRTCDVEHPSFLEQQYADRSCRALL